MTHRYGPTCTECGFEEAVTTDDAGCPICGWCDHAIEKRKRDEEAEALAALEDDVDERMVA